MSPKNFIEPFDELEDNESNLPYLRNQHRERNLRKFTDATQSFLRNQDDSRQSFDFTYKASRYEAGWLLESIGLFFEQHWISDILRLIKTGKEASVYLCRAGEAIEAPLVAVKVYRPRQLRSLKDDHLYRVGRPDLDENGTVIGDDKRSKAIRKRNTYGEDLRHQSWIAYEFQTLKTLYESGGNVPRPYEMGQRAILMYYIGGKGLAAPTLNEVELDPDEARPLFERVLHNIDIMLAHGCIHGDLSAYNILYWDGEITLIDFPQVVSVEANPAAFHIFQRDVLRICEYFISQGVAVTPQVLAAELWTAHGYRLTQKIHPRDLDAEKGEDRRLWQRQNQAEQAIK